MALAGKAVRVPAPSTSGYITLANITGKGILKELFFYHQNNNNYFELVVDGINILGPTNNLIHDNNTIEKSEKRRGIYTGNSTPKETPTGWFLRYGTGNASHYIKLDMPFKSSVIFRMYCPNTANAFKTVLRYALEV